MGEKRHTQQSLKKTTTHKGGSVEMSSTIEKSRNLKSFPSQPTLKETVSVSETSKDVCEGAGDASMVANPFFNTDTPAKDNPNQKEQLVEMLFSLIKGNKVDKGFVKKEENENNNSVTVRDTS